MQSRRPTPGSQAALREANRTRIVDQLKRHGHLTQVELAGATGLSAATVSNIVKELATLGVLNTAVTSRSGRRAIAVTIARRTGLVAGVHIAPRHLRVALADVESTVVAEHHVPLASDHRYDRELDRMALLIGDMIEGVDASPADLLAIGLALPHPVDNRTGIISSPGLMPGWDGIIISDEIAERMQVSTVVDTEANLAGLAELRTGAARGIQSGLYVSAGYTVGGSLLMEGSPYHGRFGRAGQIGHIVIDPKGPLCRCGNRGCVEVIASAPALLDGFRDDPSIHRLRDLLNRAEAGNGRALRALADAGRRLGTAVGVVAAAFDPEVVVVGGELAEAGELVLASLRHELERTGLGMDAPTVVTGLLGDRAAVLGCLAAAVDTLNPDFASHLRSVDGRSAS